MNCYNGNTNFICFLYSFLLLLVEIFLLVLQNVRVCYLMLCFLHYSFPHCVWEKRWISYDIILLLLLLLLVGGCVIIVVVFLFSEHHHHYHIKNQRYTTAQKSNWEWRWEFNSVCFSLFLVSNNNKNKPDDNLFYSYESHHFTCKISKFPLFFQLA